MSPLDPLTPREVFVLSRARRDADWNHTALLASLMQNQLAAWSGGKMKPKEPKHFHPRSAGKQSAKRISMAQFRDMCTKKE